MPKSLIENAKYASWKESHTFDNCKLNRKDYGQFLANYLIGEKDGFVLNLNGSWGTGKTEFLKRFYVELMDRGHPTIYIDAWESDFTQEPLTVVASELLNQLERLMDGTISGGVITEVKGALGKALKGTLVGLVGIASAKLLNDSAIGMEAVNKLLDEAPQNITKQLAEDYQNQIEAIIKTRDALGNLAESLQTVNGSELPVMVLIDELDRCRPTYAIEMLEVIKHFFSIKGFVFVIATDTDQLCHSIKSVYGDGFESLQYLKRFFNRRAGLPETNIESYIKSKEYDWELYSDLYLFPSIKDSETQIDIIENNILFYQKPTTLK
nr:P-loop NTPase fold protein [Aeromonas hydrophila]